MRERSATLLQRRRPGRAQVGPQFCGKYSLHVDQRGRDWNEMTNLSRLELERSLRGGRLEPLYLLLGTESNLRASAARDISDAALSGTLLREFNECSFSLLSDAVGSAIAAAAQLPMMAERRVVRIT